MNLIYISMIASTTYVLGVPISLEETLVSINRYKKKGFLSTKYTPFRPVSFAIPPFERSLSSECDLL